MVKTFFRIVLFGITVVLSIPSARAQSFQFTQGELQDRIQAEMPAPVLSEGLLVRGQSCDVVVDDGGTASSCGCTGNWYDNTVVFMGADGWKNIGDAAVSSLGDVSLSNNFGYRTGFNTGLAVFGDSLIRGQIGSSYGVYDWKGRADLNPAYDNHPDSVEQQTFVTAGLYKRGDVCAGDRVSWGVVYDHMYDTRWGLFANQVHVGQLRSVFSWARDESNAFGVWGAVRMQHDQTVILDPVSGPSTVRAVDQINAFWHHNWETGGDTTFYIGAADSNASWVFGFNGEVPLSQRVAMYANTAYLIPGSATGPQGNVEEIWNVSLGLSFYMGGKAGNSSVTGQYGLPLLNVADNGTFAVQN